MNIYSSLEDTRIVLGLDLIMKEALTCYTFIEFDFVQIYFRLNYENNNLPKSDNP